MFPDLLRIGRGQDRGRRSAMAELHGARRVLPERSAADVDWLAHAALATLDSCSDGVRDPGAGTRAGLADVSAAALANLVFSGHHALADRDHPICELHVPELPRAGPRDFAGRRPVCAALLTAISEK